jgi:hypothetical protein
MNGANASIATTERLGAPGQTRPWRMLRVSVPRQIPRQGPHRGSTPSSKPLGRALTQHFNAKTALRQTAFSD